MISPGFQLQTAAPDGKLIGRVLEGDQAALETLVLRYQNGIYNAALRMVGNPADAEDVAQEAFWKSQPKFILIKIITRLVSYDGAKVSFKTWLSWVAVNHMINMKERGYEHATLD